MMMMMMMMMMDYLCGMVDRLKTFSLISSRDNWEILTTSNLRHATSRIWTCAEPEFRLCWIKLYSNDNYYTIASRFYVCVRGEGGIERCVQSRELGARVRLAFQGLSWWHFTCGFDFEHSLWLPFADSFAVLKELRLFFFRVE